MAVSSLPAQQHKLRSSLFHCFALLLSLWSVVGESATAAAASNEESSENAVVVSSDFLEACTEGKVDELKELLKEHPDWINGRSEQGEACLHVAGIYGRTEATKLLLKTGADPNIRTTWEDGLRMHPLSWNSYAGHVDTARVLLEAGADPNLDFDAPASLFSEDEMDDEEDDEGALVKVTVMDVVSRMLESHEEDGDDHNEPHMERFQKMKALLEEFNAKTMQELTTKEEDEL